MAIISLLDSNSPIIFSIQCLSVISSASVLAMYSLLVCWIPILSELMKPLLYSLLIIFILESCNARLVRISNVLSVEPSLTIIISKFEYVCFSTAFTASSIYFSVL